MPQWFCLSIITAAPENEGLFLFIYINIGKGASLVVQNLPAMQETEEIQVPSLGREDPLEKGMATHCSILA